VLCNKQLVNSRVACTLHQLAAQRDRERNATRRQFARHVQRCWRLSVCPVARHKTVDH